MDLEKENKEYIQFKSDLELAQKEIEKLENKANSLADDKTIWKGKLVEAKRNGDTTLEKQAEKELEKIDTEIKSLQENASKKKTDFKVAQFSIDQKIKEIKANPEIKKHLATVMTKKYNRKLSKLGKEKEEAIKKKERLTILKKLITDHSSLGNNLKGIFTATKEIKNLQTELDKMKVITGTGKSSTYIYKDPNRANEIINTLLPQAQTKLNTNKSPLMTYISKNGLNITENDINELADKSFVLDGKGNIDLDTTITKNISSINRQIKGFDKSIKTHQTALADVIITTEDDEPQKHQIIQRFKNWNKNRKQQTSPNPSQPSTQGPAIPSLNSSPTTENPKWYQFIQRFKNWNERRKQQALPNPTPVIPTSPTGNQKDEFKNSLKYTIVQDVANQMEIDSLRQAKKEQKNIER